MTQKTALVILGEGFEEIEALAPVDLLRRAEVQCTTAACGKDRWVLGRSGVRVEADRLLTEVGNIRHDALIIPGGPGTGALRRDPAVLAVLRAHQGAVIGTICAAPTVLLDAGVLPPRHTGHISILPELPDLDQGSAVVTDGKVITSRGAGTALAFGLALVGALVGQAKADEVGESIHYSQGLGG